MNLSCGSKTIKYLIFSFNFFFVITGIILVAVGATVRTYFIKYDYFLNSQYFSLTNMLIATGSLIFFISFLGCYGAMKNSWILLFAFSVLLGIIFVFEFSAGIAGYVLRDKTTSYLHNSMKSSLDQYYNKKDPATGIWDFVQTKFECCGVTGPEDWVVTSHNDTYLPLTCCPKKSGQWGVFSCNILSTETTPTAMSPTPQSLNSSGKHLQDQVKLSNVALVRNKRQSGAENASSINEDPAANTSSTSTSSTTAISTVAINATTGVETKTPIPTTTIPIQTTTIPIPSTTTPYQTGCEAVFGNWVKAHAVDIGAVCFTLAVLQLIGIGFACHLSKQLKNSYYST